MLPRNNLYGGYIRGLGQEIREFNHHVFCGKLDHITQKQMGSMFYFMKVEKIDKSNIYTYTAKLPLIKIIVYLVLIL